MDKYEISVVIDNATIFCDKAVIKRSSAVSQVTTASSGVVTRNMGVKRKFLSLTGKILSEDYEYLSDLLESGLSVEKTVYINSKAYRNAQIYDFEINLKAGEKLGTVTIQLYVNNE